MMIPGAKNGDPAGVRQIQKTVCQIVKTCPFIGTLGRGHSTRTCFLVVKREFWFYRAAMCSHEGRSCRVRDFFEFTWHSFTWIKNHFMANNCDSEGWWTVSFHFSNFIRCLLFNTITLYFAAYHAVLSYTMHSFPILACLVVQKFMSTYFLAHFL